MASYEPYVAPHSGNHLQLTDEQAGENLAYLQRRKAHRIASLRALLAHFDIDLKPALSGADHRPVIETLYRWAQREWALAVSAKNANRNVWRKTNRQGEQIVYSLVMDCAIVLSEIVIAHRPAFSWAVDLDPETIQDQMPSTRRVVLQAPSLLHSEQQVIVDCEEVAVAMLLKPTAAANHAINLW